MARLFKRIIALFVITILSTQLYTFSYSADNQFTDVNQNSWYAESVIKLHDRGIIQGYPDGRFYPDKAISTGQFLTMVIRVLERLPIYEVRTQDTLEEYLREAKSLNISDDTMNASQPLIRGNMAKILSRTLKIFDEYPRMDVNGYADCLGNPDDYKAGIKDLNEIPDTWRPYVLSAFAKGAVNGNPDGTFRYKEEVTRAQACKVIEGIADKGTRQKLEMQRYLSFHDEKFVWEPGKTMFSVQYNSHGTSYRGLVQITLKEQGVFSRVEFDQQLDQSLKIVSNYSRKLSETEIQDLFQVIMNENHFFALPPNMNTENDVCDADIATLTVTVNGRYQTVGGYYPHENIYFSNILDALCKFYQPAKN